MRVMILHDLIIFTVYKRIRYVRPCNVMYLYTYMLESDIAYFVLHQCFPIFFFFEVSVPFRTLACGPIYSG